MEMWERVILFDSDFEHSPKRARLDIPPMESEEKLNSGGDKPSDDSTTSPAVQFGDDKEISSSSEINAKENPENITNGSGVTCEEEEDDDDDDEDEDDATSTVSNVSDISLMSDMSGQEWKPVNANIMHVMSWIQKQMIKGINPRKVFSQIIGDCSMIPDFVSDSALWNIIMAYLTDEPPRRSRLPNVTSLDDVISLLKKSNKILVLTGAGVSVSCGIPDFRSKDGVYARLAVDFPDLPDPQAMFDIKYFRKDPRPFFKFAKEMYPGQFRPSPCHRFIKMLEKRKKLLRNYTQNIDTLEKVAGIENVIECHGSFATASCTQCGHKVPCDDIKGEVLEQQIPYCKKCPVEPEGSERGVMKPDIVFFGEGLPESFHEAVARDKDECDLLIVIGSSLKVRPVALIPNSLPSRVPQILINRERLPHKNFDVELLGDSDVIVDHLCKILGDEWTDICWRDNVLSDVTSQLPPAVDYRSDVSSVGDSDDEDVESNVPSQSVGSPPSLTESPAQDTSKATASPLPPTPVDEEKSTAVKCQKIGKRHIPGDETSRHISLESSRDSGIGESSNSSHEGGSPNPSTSPMPDNCFYCLAKRRYIFPGAEVQGLPSFLMNTV